MTRATTLAALVTAAVTVTGTTAYAAAVGSHPSAPAAAAKVLVVSTTGNDSNAGTVAAPLLTIQVAVKRLPNGGTIELRGGSYHQRVRLAGVRGLTLRPYQHESAVLDGSGLTPPKDISAMVNISGSRNITISGLSITGYRTSRKGVVPVGIYLHGHDHAVRILNNHIYKEGNYNTTLGSFNINAHGIAAYGDDPHASISDLTIKGNTVDHLRTGASETVVVNGNVKNWAIVGNHIYDDNNIGIDAIGYETTITGPDRYTFRDRARNGLIARNRIAHIQSRGNPSYWDHGWCNCADGIYVDGGTHIRIRYNHVTTSDIGIEVAAENGKGSADYNRVTHNHVTKSLFTGLATGGYCNDKPDCGGVKTGTSHNNYWAYNVLRGNNQLNDGSPEVLIQYHSWRDTFVHNTITATNSAHVVYGTVPDADTDGHPIGNRSDHNHFRAVGVAASKAEFDWLGHTYIGFQKYRKHTGQDAHSSYRR
ncbi:MAG TPA: hypothetical protein VHW92_11780 [Mycobacteriales bacterium]|jgi:hypothetical protein|nr:hypothetical protein [Mycobacteriales bacterium]